MLVTYTTKELDLMARLMRAEALSDGNYEKSFTVL